MGNSNQNLQNTMISGNTQPNIDSTFQNSTVHSNNVTTKNTYNFNERIGNLNLNYNINSNQLRDTEKEKKQVPLQSSQNRQRHMEVEEEKVPQQQARLNQNLNQSSFSRPQNAPQPSFNLTSTVTIVQTSNSRIKFKVKSKLLFRLDKNVQERCDGKQLKEIIVHRLYPYGLDEKINISVQIKQHTNIIVQRALLSDMRSQPHLQNKQNNGIINEFQKPNSIRVSDQIAPKPSSVSDVYYEVDEEDIDVDGNPLSVENVPDQVRNVQNILDQEYQDEEDYYDDEDYGDLIDDDDQVSVMNQSAAQGILAPPMINSLINLNLNYGVQRDQHQENTQAALLDDQILDQLVFDDRNGADSDPNHQNVNKNNGSLYFKSILNYFKQKNQ
ncbi:hypothetical protein OXYTRIMIC_437 [Oxytricha trifallax]|uniref:Uncharacterized protein n=1 Tax=Oxytricha trifallax TaxID=1172189 RepID=A0A073IAT2_9SPIT|nr:hypothetical protein OXYTRIMIC_437 [Oxytricha trifallax]